MRESSVAEVLSNPSFPDSRSFVFYELGITTAILVFLVVAMWFVGVAIKNKKISKK